MGRIWNMMASDSWSEYRERETLRNTRRIADSLESKEHMERMMLPMKMVKAAQELEDSFNSNDLKKENKNLKLEIEKLKLEVEKLKLSKTKSKKISKRKE